MTKRHRQRQQSPQIPRKRLGSIDSMRVFTSLSTSLSDDTGLIPLRSPSRSPSLTSMLSESKLTSTDIDIHTNPTTAPKYPETFQSPSKSPPSNKRYLDQPANMATDGLPGPASMRDYTPPSLSLAQVQPEDTVALCQSPDTVISTNLTTPSKEWRLQSSVLVRHSTWFARSIGERQATSNGTTESYAYIITEVDGQVRLVLQDTRADDLTVSSIAKGESRSKTDIKVENHIESAAHEAVFEVYDRIFKAFYSFPPHISAADIKTATIKAEQLTKVAQDLGCTHLISSHLGNALLQHRQNLYKAILADTPRYLLLAMILENDFIYSEALIHIIGAYPCWPWLTKASALPDDIRGLIARKSKELDNEVLEVERELLLLTIVTDARRVPFSPEVASQFDTWFVIQIFRDTLAGVLREHDKSKPSLKRGSLFRKIRAGGSRYMVYEEVRRMVQRVMPSAVEELDENLSILKAKASQIVEDLARNEASLDVEENKVGWLTCVKIGKEDIPWRARGEDDL